MPSLQLVVRADCALIEGQVMPATIAVEQGRIVAVAEPGAPFEAERELVLGTDHVLLPGLVDTHVHVNEPGRTEWEGFATATAAAAAGGVTTIVDMPLNSIPPTIDPDALALKREVARAKARVDVGFWGGAVPASLGHLRELWDAGVVGFKCFLAPSGVDEFPNLDRAQLGAALAEIAGFGGLLIAHAEDPEVLHAHENAGGTSYADYLASRPPEAELASIEHLIEGVRRTGARAHIVHLSSAASLPLLADAKREGLPITAETCPHYLLFDAERIPDGATQFKCAPPIRDEANRDALWQGLVDGVIDLVVTDHSPATRELKLGADGDFGRAWGGISGLQLGLAAVWTEARRRDIGIEHVVRWMSTAPAELVGFSTKGAIRAGNDADFAVFAPDEPFTVDVDKLEHRNRVSAYDGAHLHGIVQQTILAGELLPRGGGAPRGRLLARSVG